TGTGGRHGAADRLHVWLCDSGRGRRRALPECAGPHERPASRAGRQGDQRGPPRPARAALAVALEQQPSVDGLDRGAGGDPELVAEQDPEPLVGTERLGDVPPPGGRLAEEAGTGPPVAGQL